MSMMSVGTGQAFNAGVRIDYTKHWECPRCPQQHITNRPDIHTPMHHCVGMRGVLVPFVQAGVKADFRINDRQDYLGSDTVHTDRDGNVVMSVTTLREDGEDCVVHAPCVNIHLVQD